MARRRAQRATSRRGGRPLASRRNRGGHRHGGVCALHGHACRFGSSCRCCSSRLIAARELGGWLHRRLAGSGKEERRRGDRQGPARLRRSRAAGAAHRVHLQPLAQPLRSAPRDRRRGGQCHRHGRDARPAAGVAARCRPVAHAAGLRAHPAGLRRCPRRRRSRRSLPGRRRSEAQIQTAALAALAPEARTPLAVLVTPVDQFGARHRRRARGAQRREDSRHDPRDPARLQPADCGDAGLCAHRKAGAASAGDDHPVRVADPDARA